MSGSRIGQPSASAPGRARCGDLGAYGGIRAPDEPLDDLILGERPAQLLAEGDLNARGDALAVDQSTVAVEYDELNRLDHSRSIGLAASAAVASLGPSTSTPFSNRPRCRARRSRRSPAETATLVCVTTAWGLGAAGVLRLPSGRFVRGRGLRRTVPEAPSPQFALNLLVRRPATVSWEVCWIRWPDFWLPSDPAAAAGALHEAWERAVAERVEIACPGGRGRTGTALACLAVLEGLPGREAIAYVRRHYEPRAVETLWQRRFVTNFR